MIRFFTAHPTAANLLMLVLLASGIAVLPDLQRETFPDFTTQEIQVQVVYPGAAAEDIENAICRRLEDAVDVVNDVEEKRCEAREGLATMVVEMRPGGDINRFLDDVKLEVDAVDNFPGQAEKPRVRQLGRSDQVITIALAGSMSPPDLKAYAEDIKDQLQRIAAVSQVAISGFSDHQLRIEVPKALLHQYGLSLQDISNTISRQNLTLPAGSVQTRDRDILLRFNDERRTPHDLAELIVIGASTGGEIRLGDIALIEDRFELDEDKVLIDGRRAALLKITKTKAEDTLTVVAAVKDFVAKARQTAPPGVKMILTNDIASIVQDRLRLLLANGWQGLLLVFLAMWLFFRLRFAFWVAMGLPVAFLGGLFFMAMIGLSINMLSMVALLIALGLLMDDAIVISENIATHLQNGKSALAAAIDGTQEVLPGVISSFLTTVAVFAPLAFLEGNIGKVLSVVPVVLILVIAVSLVEAFLILPHHLAHSLAKQKRPPGRFRHIFERMLDRVREQIAGRAVDAVIHGRYLFLGGVMALFLVSIGMVAGGFLKFQAFPDIEGNVIEARLLLPQGTPLARTEAIVADIEAALERVDAAFTPMQTHQQRLVQNTTIEFNQNQDSKETGPHLATLRADLLNAEERVGHIDAILQRWRIETGEIADAISLNFKEPSIGPAGLAIDIRLQGPNLDDLKAASLTLQDWLSRYRGVADLSDDLRPGKPEVQLRLREGALNLGIDANTISSQLQAAFQGIDASEIQRGAEAYEINVRLAESDRSDFSALADFPIITANGDQVPLSTVALITESRGYARILRVDGQRTVTVQGDVDTRLANAAEIIADTEARFLPELQNQYPDIRFALQGQAEEGAKTGGSLARGFLLGLLGIFVLLSFQFRNYIEPVIVMTIIPLALIGVVWGHLFMGLNLSMPSMMGFVSLAGIVVNDSILLVMFLKLRVGEGLSVPDAAKQASRDRFRAVLLTSITTIMGLLPLLAERSLQAQVLIPLAASMVFGLLATTILVLFVVPALYTVLDDFALSKPEHRADTQITNP